MIEEGPKGDKPDNVPNYVTESGYTEEIKGRTNVGDPQERTRVAILDAVTGEVQWADPGLGDRAGESRSAAVQRTGHARRDGGALRRQ